MPQHSTRFDLLRSKLGGLGNPSAWVTCAASRKHCATKNCDDAKECTLQFAGQN